jgi:hypothetical protein
MSTRTISSLNPTLTTYAQGLSQDLRNAVADFIAPITPVPSSIGQYKQFDEKNMFQIYNTARGLGGPATRIKFGASDPTYNCTPQALEIPIDDAERKAAGTSDPLGMEQNKVRTLVMSSLLARENKVSTAVAAVTAVVGVGAWSVPANDPVEEIDQQIEAIVTATGMMPNRLVFGLGAWRRFRQHALVLKRMPGAELIGVTYSQAAAMLLNPEIEIRVAAMSKDASKWGKTKDAENVFGSSVLVFIGSDNPTQYDPSFMKTFVTQGDQIDGVREYRDETARSDVYAIDWTEDIKETSTSSRRKISIT